MRIRMKYEMRKIKTDPGKQTKKTEEINRQNAVRIKQ